jgi:hypothetical protein
MARVHDRCVAIRIATGAALCVPLLLASARLAGKEILVSQGDCASGVHLVARDARLSEVLKRLSETLGFQLEFKATSDPVISIDVSRPAPELVAGLSPSESVIVTHAQDPRCPRQYRIAKVWVLPKATSDAAPTATPRPASTAPSAPTVLSSPEQIRRVEEMSRLRKQLYDAYVKEHGVPPPSQEEENAK